MARFGHDYQVDVENTEKQGGGGILPHMYALIWAESIDLPETKDGKGNQAAITFEVQEPEEFRGRKMWAYWTCVHADGWEHKAYKYGKPMFDRFARAVDVDITADTDTDELLYKSFTVEIAVQPGQKKADGSGFYNDKNEIKHFFYSDPAAKEPIPPLGVIDDAAGAKPANDNRAAANDNRAAAAAPAAKAAGSRPWPRPH